MACITHEAQPDLAPRRVLGGQLMAVG
jgi:hypothetical protein